MGKEEFVLQVVQRRIIEVELSFEQAIGNAFTAPEQVHNLVEYGVKVQRLLPSTLRVWLRPYLRTHHTRIVWNAPQGDAKRPLSTNDALTHHG